MQRVFYITIVAAIAGLFWIILQQPNARPVPCNAGTIEDVLTHCAPTREE